MNKKSFFIFFSILLVAIILRTYLLSEVPPGVNRDEASIGYTAYSLLETGKDEYGRLFPLSFQSFGDWKLPFYIYTTIPFVWLFGLSEIAVRLPSALFGTITIGLTFFLVKILFKNTFLAFLTMLLLTISPWHLHLSRVESESNTAVFLIVTSVILLLKSFGTKPWLLTISALLFALTYFTYAGNYIFTTLLILGIIAIYKDILFGNKYAHLSLGIFLLLSGVIWFHTLSGNTTKVSGINIFSNPSIVHAEIELPRNEHANPQSLIATLMHNRITFATQRFFQNYLNAYSPDFLFIKGGGNHAHNISGFGNMYLVEAPFLVLGFIYLVAFMKGKEKRLVLFWFLIAPFAASITKDAPHTNREFAIFPVLPLITAMGVHWFLEFLTKRSYLKNVAIGLIAFIFAANFGIYLDQYYVHFPNNEFEHWGIGYRKLNKVLNEKQFASKQVVMSHPEYSAYIFLLFYQKYDPSFYQQTAVRYPPTEDGFVHVKSYDRFTFREINWGKDLASSDTILVDFSSNMPESVEHNYPHISIDVSNGTSMFNIVETK